MIPAIVKDHNLNQYFETNGFSEFHGISSSIINACRDLFKEYFNPVENNMFVSHYESKPEINIAVSNSLQQIFQPWLEVNFVDYKFVIGHYIIKSTVNSKEFALHQDWNIVDEKKFPFIHIWIPLQETNEENGGLYVLPQSHNILGNLRSGSLKIPFVEIENGLANHIKSFQMKEGSAIGYSPALFHGSFPNKSSASRMTVLLAITHKDAPLHYYHKNNDGDLEVYSIENIDLLQNLKHLASGEKPMGKEIIKKETITGISNSDINGQLLLSLL